MNRLKLLIRWIIPICIGVFVITGIGSAQHHVYLQVPNTIPSYCQEDNIWCGAATAQMILEGYPGEVEHPYTQTHIWQRIQAHKDDLGVNWATDPDGLRDALMELGGDPGVNWVIFDNPTSQSLMYTIAYWMTRRLYPAAILVNGWQHWVAITGITTDVDPTTTNSVTLQYIEIIDPWNPPCPTAASGGVKSWITGSTWYSDYFYTAGNYPASKWDGNYIAVVEPPLKEGVARAPTPVDTGRVISDSTAKQQAMMWIKKLHLDEREPYTLLRKIKPLKPLLVNREYKGYYIVPFGYEEGEISQAAVLVNAYNGDFQEVGVFHNPIKYLSKDQTVKIALDYLCFCRAKSKARLIFQPSEQTESRFLPIWKITVEKRRWIFFKRVATVYVTQEGKVFERLTKLPLGD